MKKRILSMLLVLTMVFSCLPATALATEAEGEDTSTDTGIEATYTMQAGDVVFAPGTVAEDSVSEAYIVNTSTEDTAVGDAVTVAALTNDKYGSSRTAGKFWECVEVKDAEGNVTGTEVKCVTGIWYSDSKFQYGYHDAITEINPAVEADEANGIAAAPASIRVNHAPGHVGGDKQCGLGFADACGDAWKKTRQYECARVLNIADDLAIINLVNDDELDLNGVKALTDAGTAVINVYVPDGASSGEGKQADHENGLVTGTAKVIVVTAATKAGYAIPKAGEVYFVPGTVTVDSAKGNIGFYFDAYVADSTVHTIGEKVRLFVPVGTDDKYPTGRFWRVGEDGIPEAIHHIATTNANGNNGQYKFGYHDAVKLVKTDEKVVVLQDGMQHRAAATDSNTAKACSLGFAESCGTSGNPKSLHGNQLGPYVNYTDDTVVIDLRTGVTDKIDSIEELATLASNANEKGGELGEPVVNTYAADAVYTSMADYKTLAGNLTVVFIVDGVPATEYAITVDENIENGTVSVDITAGRKGDTVTVTAVPNVGYMPKSILVDGVAISGNTFTISKAHTVSAEFEPCVELVAGDVIFVPGYVANKGNYAQAYVLTSETPAEKVNVHVSESFPWSSASASWAKQTYKDSFWKINETGKPVQLNGTLGTALTAETFAIHDAIAAYTVGAEVTSVTFENATGHNEGMDKCAYNWNDKNCGEATGHGYEMTNATLSANCAVIDLRTLAEGETAITDVTGLIDLVANNNYVIVNAYGSAANEVSAIFLLESTPGVNITVGEVANGTVTFSPCVAIVGTKVTVTATPAEGYSFEAVQIDGEAIYNRNFIVTGDHEITATFAENLELADGDVIYVPGEVRYADRAYNGYVVKSSNLPVGTEVSVALVSKTVSTEFAKNEYTDRFWTCEVKTTSTEVTDEETGETSTVETTTVSYSPDKDVYHIPEQTLGIHDRFVSYDAEANTMVIDDATGHEFQDSCAYRPDAYNGLKETCGHQDRTKSTECAQDGNLTLADSVYVLDLRTLAEGETAVTDVAGIAALAENGEVIMNIYCAEPDKASFFVILEVAPTYDITVAEGIENGTVTISSQGGSENVTTFKAAAGDQLKINATPAEGYMVDRWTVDGQGQNHNYFTTTGAHVVGAVFRLPVITVGTVKNGTVEVDKTSAALGETVTVTATAAESYELESILVDGVAIDGNTFVITGDHKVTATFVEKAAEPEPTTYAITVGAVENGTVTVDKASAEAGEIVTVTVTANEGYEIGEVKANDELLTGENGVYTFTVTGATEITATFTEVVPEVTGTLTVKTFTCALEDMVFINVKSELTEFTGEVDLDKFGLLVWKEDTFPGKENVAYDSNYAVYGEGATTELTSAGVTRYVIKTEGIPAAELNDTLYMVPFYDLGNGNYIYGFTSKGEVFTRSPGQYALGQAGKGTTLANMCEAMLNYGSAAQAYFYKTAAADQMNATLTDAQRDLAWDGSLLMSVPAPSADQVAGMPRNTAVCNSRTATLALEGAISLNYKVGFIAPAGTTVESVKLLCWDAETVASGAVLTEANAMTDKGGEMELDSTGKYVYTYDGIAAAEVAVYRYACAVATMSDGSVHYSGVISTCPAALANTTINKATSDPALVQLYKAMLTYGKKARVHFWGEQ